MLSYCGRCGADGEPCKPDCPARVPPLETQKSAPDAPLVEREPSLDEDETLP